MNANSDAVPQDEGPGEDEHALRAPVLTELAACYGTDDWPWLSDLADVVVGLIEEHAQAVIDARWAAVFAGDA